MRNDQLRILVLDANQRSALAVTRSLGAHQHFIITADETVSALAGSSKFSRDYIQCPSPARQPKEFCEWLRATTASAKIDWVFPVTEISSQLILLHPEALGEARLPFASLECVMSLADKWQLIQLAETLGIKHPRSSHYNSGAELNATIIANLTYPVVLKPTQSRRWLGDRWLSTAVHIADSAEQLTNLIQNTAYFRDFPFMLQEYIPGHGAGIFALYNQGSPITFFAHQRLREKPPRGGVSVFSRSVPLDPRLLETTKTLLGAANWHGVAMVEFKISADGTPYIMEVNTRFWGSLQLAIDAGVDFPSLLLQVCADGASTPPRAYRINQRLRWLLGDVDSLYLLLRDPDFSLTQKVRRILDFITPRPFSTKHEVNRWSDLAPAWHELKTYISSFMR